MSVEEIKNYWNQKARQFALSHKGEMGNTLDDENLRGLEIAAIEKYLSSNTRVLDIGCGNGFSTLQFAKKKDIFIDGMDYAEDMVKNALDLLKLNPQLKERVKFFVGDVTGSLPVTNKYDIIITERCLINLCSWERQKQAFLKIKDMLNENGKLLMLEGVKDNLDKLNEVRSRLKLPPIKVVWHNLFFEKEKFETFISKHFKIEAVDNFGSTYMLISRSILHKVFKDKFDKDIDYLTTLLPNFGNYNYQQLYVLSKL